MLEIYCKNLSNVKINIAVSSPVKDCYDFGENLTSGTVIFGCSKKGEDIARWNRVKDYYETNFPGITVMDPSITAVDPSNMTGEVISATQFRAAFGDRQKMAQFLPDHLDTYQKQQVLNLLES